MTKKAKKKWTYERTRKSLWNARKAFLGSGPSKFLWNVSQGMGQVIGGPVDFYGPSEPKKVIKRKIKHSHKRN